MMALTRGHERSAALPDGASHLMRGVRRVGLKSYGLPRAPPHRASLTASGTAPRHERRLKPHTKTPASQAAQKELAV